MLGGGIDTVNGDITVGVGSHVKGGIKVEKPSPHWLPISFGKRTPPRIIVGPNAVVDGPLVFEREVKLYVHSSARIGSVSGATAAARPTSSAPETRRVASSPTAGMPTSLRTPVVRPLRRWARKPRSGPLHRSSARPSAATSPLSR